MIILAYQRRTIKAHLTCLWLLVSFCFVFLSHSHDFSFDASHTSEQIDCKLCQQQIDPPKQSIKIAQITLGAFSLVEAPLFEQYSLSAKYGRSNPRAPPYSS
jgi:hypothetical protein